MATSDDPDYGRCLAQLSSLKESFIDKTPAPIQTKVIKKEDFSPINTGVTTKTSTEAEAQSFDKALVHTLQRMAQYSTLPMGLLHDLRLQAEAEKHRLPIETPSSNLRPRLNNVPKKTK